MNINLNAFRINSKETTVFITFSQIKNDGLDYVKSAQITNSNREIGVIFHVKNKSQTDITSGTETLSFKADFDIDTDSIRVFYWNDSDSLSDNIYCFEEFLKAHGLDERAPEIVNCPQRDNKSKNIPREARNGGVLRIVDIP